MLEKAFEDGVFNTVDLSNTVHGVVSSCGMKNSLIAKRILAAITQMEISEADESNLVEACAKVENEASATVKKSVDTAMLADLNSTVDEQDLTRCVVSNYDIENSDNAHVLEQRNSTPLPQADTAISNGDIVADVTQNNAIHGALSIDTEPANNNTTVNYTSNSGGPSSPPSNKRVRIVDYIILQKRYDLRLFRKLKESASVDGEDENVHDSHDSETPLDCLTENCNTHSQASSQPDPSGPQGCTLNFSENAVMIKCDKWQRNFYGRECYERHLKAGSYITIDKKKLSVCEFVYFCKKCYKIAKLTKK
ncbi:hypothetical protein QAD02_021798 [Eretmocerus hayati]|uniref:Uncharacterized protein n=1 Tax=Eretmocerus hayati TaxID=131215 RepID=A0ACC2PQW8_9HYME|nr:hypothetical protein QAD02_021798 [Eretmocerus hayati]